MTKYTGTVKWFSNRKGYGFIIPSPDNKPKEGDDDVIFVHQTSIFSDGDYRTLVAGANVEFEVEKEDSGKLKAVNVTAPGGGSLKPPPKRERRPQATSDDDNKVKNNNNDKKESVNAEPPKREPPFHSAIQDDLKAVIAGKGLELGRKVTIDVKFGGARIKLGQGGYAALAHQDGLVGEGTFVCDKTSRVTFTWERCLALEGDVWKSSDTSKLLSSFSLAEDDVGPVGGDETAETLWGAGKDPSPSLSDHGFKMKRIVLTRPANTSSSNKARRRRPRVKKG